MRRIAHAAAVNGLGVLVWIAPAVADSAADPRAIALRRLDRGELPTARRLLWQELLRAGSDPSATGEIASTLHLVVTAESKPPPAIAPDPWVARLVGPEAVWTRCGPIAVTLPIHDAARHPPGLIAIDAARQGDVVWRRGAENLDGRGGRFVAGPFAGAGRIWVAIASADRFGRTGSLRLLGLDRDSAEVVETIAFDGAVSATPSVSAAFGFLFVTAPGTDGITRVDAVTGRAESFRIEAREPSSVEAAFEKFAPIVTLERDGEPIRCDAVTGRRIGSQGDGVE